MTLGINGGQLLGAPVWCNEGTLQALAHVYSQRIILVSCKQWEGQAYRQGLALYQAMARRRAMEMLSLGKRASGEQVAYLGQ